MQVAEIISSVVGADVPVRVIGYDGSKAGPDSSELALRINSPRALARLATAPGTLGLARAYVSGEIEVEGDLYELLAAMADLTINDLSRADQLRLVRRMLPIWLRHHQPPPAARVPPAGPAALQAARLEGDRAPLRRVQPLLRVGARPVDGLHVRGVPDGVGVARGGPDGQARAGGRRSSRWSPACGCSTSAAAGAAWSCTPRPSTASRRWASRSRATRPSGRRPRSSAAASAISPRCATATTATCPSRSSTRSARSGSPSTSASRNLAPTSRRCTPGCGPRGGCSTTASPSPHPDASGRLDPFIARYVFPDGQLEPVGLLISEMNDAGFEVRHEENLREHYALTLHAWGAQPRGALGRRGRRRRDRAGPGVAALHGRLRAGLRARQHPAAPGAGGAADRPRRLGLPVARVALRPREWKTLL